MGFEELKKYWSETVADGGVTDPSHWEGFATALWVLGMISESDLDKFIEEKLLKD